MTDPGLQKVIDAELAKKTEPAFNGFTLTDHDSKWWLDNRSRTEWNFVIPMQYQGNRVYYVPKSYVERGYAWTNPNNGNVEWFATPAFLNPELQTFLRPARLDERLASNLDGYFSQGTAHIQKVPDFANGYIIDRGMFDQFRDVITQNGKPQSTVYRWDNPMVVPQQMTMYNGELVYMGLNQWSKGYNLFYTPQSVDKAWNQSAEAGRSLFGSFFDSIGLEDVGDFIEGPIFSTLLILSGNPTAMAAGYGLAAGNAIRNENWGQLALLLVSANTPGADGKTMAGGTVLEIPAIANATKTISTTLGVSAQTAGLIMRGTVDFLANGFDLEEALKSTAAHYVGSQVGSKVGDLLKAEGFQNLATLTQNVTAASTKAILLNQPIDKAAREAFVRTAVPMTLESVPNVDKLSIGQYQALQNALITKGLNPDVDLSTLLKGAVSDVITYDIINKSPEFKDMPENIKQIAFDSMRDVVYGKDLNQVFTSALTKTVYAQLENQIKEVQAQNEGWDSLQQKIGAQKTFGPEYKTEITPFLYRELVNSLRSTTFNADTDDKIATVNEARDAAMLGGYNTFVFDNKLYTIGGYSLDAATALYNKQGEEFIFPLDVGLSKEANKLAAYKAGFNTVDLGRDTIYDPVAKKFIRSDRIIHTITPEEQKKFQQQIDFPGIFDGSKYSDVNEAAKAAAAVNESKFRFGDAVYVVKAPESVTNQIKDAKTWNEAFALAQQRLGEGNVFEWNGKLYVNKTKEQAATDPFNGNKYEDRGAAAYAAHMAGRTTFTWGGNTWELPKDYAAQISAAISGSANQTAAETKRLLDANTKVAESLPPNRIELMQTGVPVLDKVIGFIAYRNGSAIEGVGNGFVKYAQAHSLATGTPLEANLNAIGRTLTEFGQSLQLPDWLKTANKEIDNIKEAEKEAAKTGNFFEHYWIMGKAALNNRLGFLTIVDREFGEDMPEGIAAGVALVTLPASGWLTGGALMFDTAMGAVKTYGENGYARQDELLREGKSMDEARFGGNVMGLATAAAEIPFALVENKLLFKPYIEALNGAAQSVAKTFVNPLTASMAVEYAQTFTEGVVTQVIKGEPINIQGNMASATFASLIQGGVSAGVLAPGSIIGAAQIGLDYAGRPVTFNQLITPPSDYIMSFGDWGILLPPEGGGSLPGGGPPPGGGGDVDLSTIDLNAPIATLSDGSKLTLAGLQMILPETGLNRSFISEIAPELAVNRNSVVAYSSKNEPIQLRYSQPFFQKHLIQVGPIPTITETDARKLLQSQGRNEPTQAEIDQVMDKAKDEQDTDIAKQVSDPFTVSLEEVKEAARAAGYAISDDEAKKYVGERLESEAIPLLQQQFDPLATTEEEVRQIFAERGYTPTQQEIERFVGSTPEAQIQSQVKTYVDPRMLYPEDIKNLAAQEGYQISDARARELSGQKDKQSNLNALRAEFDAGAVTLDEARAMFAQTPYKPTDAEIQQFVGSKSESQIRQEIANYADPRYVTAQEIKDAAALEGYQITDEDALALAGQKMQAETIAKFRSDIDAKAVTEAEARAFFNEFGYKPTPQELQQFTASRSEEQIKADISAYVDPRYVTLDEVKKVAAEEGYAITDDEALSLTGQKSQQEVLDQLRVKADAAAVLQSEAQEFFREFGYTPTPEELQQFTLSKPESAIREDIRAYVDPRFVTLEEVKAAAKEEGYDLTDQEAAAIVGQRNQEEAITQFRSTINPKAVTESESREFFKQLGYEPTPEELRMFTASRSEEQVQADLAAYVNPRYVTMEEVKAVAASEGYDISDEEALALTGQKSEKEVLDALRAKADTSAVLRSEAEEYFRELGYTPTEEEVNQFVASRPEADIRAELGAYVDPRFVTLEEVKEAARAEGYDLTDEEAAALVGQKSQEEVISQFREQIDPKAVIDAEAQAFFAEFGYVPNNDELSLFIQSRSEEQVREDIQTYIDPRQVTREEVEAKFRELQSEYGFTPEEIEQFIRSGQDITQESVLGEIGGYIDPRYVTPEEVKAGYAELGLTTPLEDDVSKFTGQTAQEGLQERLQEYLPTAQFNYTAKQLADLQAENARKQEIKRLNDQFVLDITALIDQNVDIKIAIDQTLGKIDDPTQKQLIDIGSPSIQMLAQQQATKKAAQQQQKQQLVQQGLEMMGGQTPADTQVMSEPFKPDVQSLYSGDPGDEFISPLAPFLEKVEEGSYTGEPQPQTAEQPLAESKDLTDMKRREQGYFTYGQPSEIDQNIAAASDPFGYYSGMAMSGGMKEGGMVVPLMAEGGGTRYGRYAGGGLNLVPHTGKMRVDFREGDAVTGAGDGQSDDIPAMLADGEFVIPADVVAALGNGSTKAGSDKLYDMMHSIRSHVRSADPKKLPPPVKSPLDYISKRPKAKRR